jgi:hypothetical protein
LQHAQHPESLDLLLKHTNENNYNIRMKQLKQSKHAFKTHEEHLENNCKHMQHPDKILYNMCVKHMQHPDKHTCNICLKKTDETLATDICNIRVPSLQHIQHPDPLLQHPYETLETYPTKYLKHLKHAPGGVGARGQAIPTVGVGGGAARAPPPSPSLAALGLAWPAERRGMGERDGWKRAAQDGRVAAARWNGCTTSGQEGRG